MNDTATTFPARLANGGEAGTVHRGGLRLLGHVLDGGMPLESLRLVRFDGLADRAPTAGSSWRADFHETAVRGLERALPSGAAWLRHDDAGYLLVVPDDPEDTAGAVAAAMRQAVESRFPGPWAPSVWRPVARTENGLACVPDSAATDTAARSPGGRPGPSADTAAVPGAGVVESVRLPFVALWAVRRRDLYGYVCEPCWEAPDGRPLLEDSLGPALDDAESRFRFDLHVLDHVERTAMRLLEIGRPLTLVAPVHLSTLLDDGREQRFIRALLRVFSGFGDLIAFEIRGITGQEDLAHLAHATYRLRPECHELFARVPPGVTDLAAFAGTGVDTAALEARGDSRPERAQMAGFDPFVAEARRHGLATAVHGLGSVSLSVAAACAGFDLVGSDVIGRTENPAEMLEGPVSPLRLFSHLSG